MRVARSFPDKTVKWGQSYGNWVRPLTSKRLWRIKGILLSHVGVSARLLRESESWEAESDDLDPRRRPPLLCWEVLELAGRKGEQSLPALETVNPDCSTWPRAGEEKVD